MHRSLRASVEMGEYMYRLLREGNIVSIIVYQHYKPYIPSNQNHISDTVYSKQILPKKFCNRILSGLKTWKPLSNQRFSQRSHPFFNLFNTIHHPAAKSFNRSS